MKIKRSYSSKGMAKDFEKRKSYVIKQFKAIETLSKLETGSKNNFPNRQKYATQAHMAPLAIMNVENERTSSADTEKEGPAVNYEKLEDDLNKEPPLVYKKNSLVLEKVILDRALDKVQNRRFVRQTMTQTQPVNANY